MSDSETQKMPPGSEVPAEGAQAPLYVVLVRCDFVESCPSLILGFPQMSPGWEFQAQTHRGSEMDLRVPLANGSTQAKSQSV
eukprot:CAMPEP_0180464098 /NCGR_PEP_ID=MMETSP1036_2-20121128/25269_1 /TAXON_ID=632150 /ORGANISM="Azadinium spinosum, Strain 3D9" /LENGTH=81 /DNA_ID=CAMNT_0022470939 /DNA_START=1253 /DNA_END=1499 /DNA_ORIENTATION=-